MDFSDLIREYYLEPSPESAARRAYLNGHISAEEFEAVLDAVYLGVGRGAAVRCPRCDSLMYGFAPADNGTIALRCRGEGCYFVGYTEYDTINSS